MLQISDDASTPLYQRIVDAVCEAVGSGTLTPGRKLPTRVELAESLGISPVTVSRSYELLQQRGVILQKRGSGTYVQPDALDRLKTIADSRPRFSSIVMVVGKPSLEQCPRDKREYITDIMVGVDDVLQQRAGRFVFAESLDHASLGDVTDDSAVLLIAPKHFEPGMLDTLAQRGVRVLGAWPSMLDRPVPAITFDPHQAPALACQHLIDCGYRQLGYIGEMGPSTLLGAKFFEFTNVLYRAGLDYQIQHVHEVSQAPGAAFEAAHEMAQAGDLPEAFFVGTDYSAMEVIRALIYMGLRVPEDVAVVGYGDIPEAARYTPPLTTVRLPRRQIGQRAGELLADNTPLSSTERFMLESELIVRGSTAGARKQVTVNEQAAHEQER